MRRNISLLSRSVCPSSESNAERSRSSDSSSSAARSASSRVSLSSRTRVASRSTLSCSIRGPARTCATRNPSRDPVSNAASTTVTHNAGSLISGAHQALRGGGPLQVRQVIHRGIAAQVTARGQRVEFEARKLTQRQPRAPCPTIQLRRPYQTLVFVRAPWNQIEDVFGGNDRQQEGLQIAVDCRDEYRTTWPDQRRQRSHHPLRVGYVLQHLHAGDYIETGGGCPRDLLRGDDLVGYVESL